MPTYEFRPGFARDVDRLTPQQYQRFRRAVAHMVDDLKAGRPFRAGLRIKRFERQEGVFEMTWAPDGRALFRYGESPRPGHVHIVWLRVGGHDIFER